jgi:hypothetical protein
VSLFTKEPIKETKDLLERHFEEDVLGLFGQVLTTSYLTFNGQFYGHTDGVVMGSPLSAVIANFYMEDYEKAARESPPPLIPRCWFRYVDDTVVSWQHGPDNLKDFPHHLNSIHQSIQFTMETESEGHLPLLHLDIYRRPDGSLGHKVYHKPTHTNLYLYAKSHFHQGIYRGPDGSLGHKVYRKNTHTNLHFNAMTRDHPSNNQAVLSTLIHRARALCDEDSLQVESVFLKDVFKQNGYKDRQIHRALDRRFL